MQYYNKKTGKRITCEQAYKMRDTEKIVIDETKDGEPIVKAIGEKKVNCNAICRKCREQNVFYFIEQGHFFYYCNTCKKFKDSISELLTPKTITYECQGCGATEQSFKGKCDSCLGKTRCLECGITLMLDEELEDKRCSQCEAIHDKDYNK